jgi:hypothetical protein
VFAKAFFTPAHRASSEDTPAPWITQRAFWPPSLASRAPAVSPARDSSDPKYIIAPYFW